MITMETKIKQKWKQMKALEWKQRPTHDGIGHGGGAYSGYFTEASAKDLERRFIRVVSAQEMQI